MAKIIFTIIMLVAVPVAIILNDEGWLEWTPNRWGAFILIYLLVMCGFSVVVATTDGSKDRL